MTMIMIMMIKIIILFHNKQHYVIIFPKSEQQSNNFLDSGVHKAHKSKILYYLNKLQKSI